MLVISSEIIQSKKNNNNHRERRFVRFDVFNFSNYDVHVLAPESCGGVRSSVVVTVNHEPFVPRTFVIRLQDRFIDVLILPWREEEVRLSPCNRRNSSSEYFIIEFSRRRARR